MPTNPIRGAAKAWIALAGVIATALLGEFGPGTAIGHILVIVAVVATAATTYAVRNTPATDAPPRSEEVEGTH